ncbi:MAG: ABC transporter substrate-binding protein, partial [Desulfovibrionales bacterium]
SERIHKPADLSGATIGLKHMSIAQFYLEQFLVFHDVPPQEVTTREISLEKAPQALASNRIDAVLIFEPYLEDVLETLNQDTVIFPAQQEQDLFWVLLGSKGRVSQNPDIIRSFLVSLLEAEKFIRENTEEAEEMLAADLGLEDLSLKRYTFDLSLDQPLILTMENEARWIKKHLFKGREKIPNFLRYIHFESLQEINPQGVTIIH